METDWLGLWRDMVNETLNSQRLELFKRYESHARKKAERADPLLDFILKNSGSQDSVIDIGAGNGRWTIPLAKKVNLVTAIEPTDGIAGILRENLADAQISNVEIIPQTWEEARIQTHDIVVCAHAMYNSPDLSAFVRKMEKLARKRCYLAIRLPPSDGIIAELSIAINKRLYDSPNAIIAYNALYSMGIYANVLIEEGPLYSWTNSNLEEAFRRAKRHLHQESSTTYDALIRQTLEKRLVFSNDCYIWPDGMRSALLWWDVQHSRQGELPDARC